MKKSGLGGVLGHSLWGGALISSLLGNVLPRPGTVYRRQDLRFLQPRVRGLTEHPLRVQTGQRDPAASVKAIACAFVVLMYSNEAMDLYRLAIAEQRNFPELGELISRFGPEPIFWQLSSHLADLKARGILHIPNVEIASQLFLGMLQGHKHFRCLMGLQPGLSEAEEKESIIDAAVSLFLKGHGYEV